MVRYQSVSLYLQASYTYSHSIDNQSDPLRGDFLDLTAFRQSRDAQPSRLYGLQSPIATFTRQFDTSVDRASSDFDQRHNFTAYSVWHLPPARSRNRILRSVSGGWQFAQLLSIRSGFPYTVYAGTKLFKTSPGDFYPIATPEDGATLLNNRPNLLTGSSGAMQNGIPVDGGVRVLNIGAFSNPSSAGQIGNLGRNSFLGPGFWNADASVARSFSIPGRGEALKMQFRADFFNVFNHANLGSPDSLLSSPDFGQAYYGRTSTLGTSLLGGPLQESPRTIQLQLKVYF